MLAKRGVVLVLAVVLSAGVSSFGKSLEEDWKDLLHYMATEQYDLARESATKVLDAKPTAQQITALGQMDTNAYKLLLKMRSDEELGDVIGQIVTIVEQGRVWENWNDFIHYTKIGRYDLASGYARKIIDGSPDPKALYELSETDQDGYRMLLKMQQSNPELKEASGRIIDLINMGKLELKTSPKVIVAEIKRLSGTIRAQLSAQEALRNSGEYAIPFMLDALADESRKEEFPNIIAALGKMDRKAVNPFVAALQTDNVAVKAQIIKALGQIGYPQSLAYLRFVSEKDASEQLRGSAVEAINIIDPQAMKLPASELFFQLAENYYYHNESLAPDAEYKFGNMWFWDTGKKVLNRLEIDGDFYNELMAMRCCEWALKADPKTGKAISLWIAAFFKAQSTGLAQPAYFGQGHMDAMNYATTAGPEYLHEALERAIRDNNAYVALGLVEAMAANAGEKSLLWRIGMEQPLVKALSFNDKKVRYSAAIAIGQAGPGSEFPGSELIIQNLASALKENGNSDMDQALADQYALRAINVMLNLAVTRNSVVDVSRAIDTLVAATKDSRQDIRVLAAEVLARIENPDAQRAIADMALEAKNSDQIRIAAFQSLAVSAKLNANLLTESQINAIYSLVSSGGDSDPRIRSAAASAYGALNLPSERVKDLILGQSRL